MRLHLPEAIRFLKVYRDNKLTGNRVFNGRNNQTKFLAAAPTIESLPTFGDIPEVLFTGRANVGKSSLINYVCARSDMAQQSRMPGRTRALNFYCVRKAEGPVTLMLVDSPGYGARGRPEWGELFDHYIRNRTELRCVYLLVNALHGVTEDDKFMLRFLETESLIRNFRVQPVLTKIDKVPAGMLADAVIALRDMIQGVAPKTLPILATGLGVRRYGKDQMRCSILSECGWIPGIGVLNGPDTDLIHRISKKHVRKRPVLEVQT